MSRWVRYSAFVFLALMCASGVSFAKKLPRIETRLNSDSTVFSMQLLKGSRLEVGKTFKVKIHVKVHPGWHVWSSTQSPDDDILPHLLVKISDSLSNYFEIENIKEYSKIVEPYDSNFLIQTKAIFEPFDLIVTVKVKKEAPSNAPFSLLARYQAVDSTTCEPPFTVPIPMTFLGQKPIILKIAGGTKLRKNHLGKVKPAT